MSKTCYLFLLIVAFHSHAICQFSENFGDGEFITNPAWTGNSSDWIVNAGNELQSNSNIPSTSFYLSTPSILVTDVQWKFDVELDFNPSSSNYADVFLISAFEDPRFAMNTGYFIRIGSSQDNISLLRKDPGTEVSIIEGIPGSLNSSTNKISITVSRHASGDFTLSREINSTGVIYEGTVNDLTYDQSSYFSILVQQSTSTFFFRHYFDNIEAGVLIPDNVPPILQSVQPIDSLSVLAIFNEPVSVSTSEVPGNYFIGQGIGHPTIATRDPVDHRKVRLLFAHIFPSRVNLELAVNNVQDLFGNSAINHSFIFCLYHPARYDILIHEIMADPSPGFGLPETEWVELRNVSPFKIDMSGWKIGNGNSFSGPLPAFFLEPDSLLTICSSTYISEFLPYGEAVAVASFPSLPNEDGIIVLQSPSGMIIHGVGYDKSLYETELKKEGGWSLEMIDHRDPCSGSTNWKECSDQRGGTPSRVNSSGSINPDHTGPELLHVYPSDGLNLILVFSEPVSHGSASDPASYNISPGIGIPVIAEPVEPIPDKVKLKLSSPLHRNNIYTVTVNGITDCSGNGTGVNNTSRVGIPETAGGPDVAINEILFNPKPPGSDFIELFNRGSKIIDLSRLSIANINSSGMISDIKQVSEFSRLLFPGDYIVLTPDPEIIKDQYLVKFPLAFSHVSLPAYNDDEGNVILLNEQGEVIDQVDYLEDWHFALLPDKEGVSLERINPHGISNNRENWHSAASTVNYATPTYANSQSVHEGLEKVLISINPSVISPDNDGKDDIATIHFNLPEAGYIANISIFDAVGRRVRDLKRNALTGIRGFYTWDGLGEGMKRLVPGMYIIYTEIFNLKGETQKFRNSIVIAQIR